MYDLKIQLPVIPERGDGIVPNLPHERLMVSIGFINVTNFLALEMSALSVSLVNLWVSGEPRRDHLYLRSLIQSKRRP